MRLTRCFVPTPLSAGSTVTLPEAAATHVARVLRLHPGAALTLFDGRGGEYEAQLLEVARGDVRARVGEHRSVEREAPVRLTLLQCLVRGERMDWIVQKATELGVRAIVPVASRHSVVQLDDAARARRLAHWRAVAISACEQCGRNRLPEVRPARDFDAACAEADPVSVRVLLSPEAAISLTAVLIAARPVASDGALASDRPTTGADPPAAALSVTLLIGPEGGIAAHELAIAQRCRFQSCRLGPRTLRAETAPLAALAAIQAVVGDFI